jgi:tetratricopeptide (TPR) repeat protein
VGDPLDILDLRRAIAGATAAEIRRIVEDRLPLLAAPVTEPEFDAWTWSLYDLGLAAETIPDPRLALDLYARSIGYNRFTEHLRSAAMVRSGLCLEQLGRWMEAKQIYQEALPGSFGWPENRALLLWRLGRLQSAAEEFVEARSSFGQLLDLLPQPGIPRHEVILEWANCLDRTGQTDAAAAALTDLAAGSHPYTVEALLRLSSLYLRSGQQAQAAATLEVVVRHPMAEPASRSAAALRLDQLQGSQE